MGLSMQTMTKQEWTEFSWRNNGYNDKFRVDTRLEHGFAIDFAYIQTVCTLLSLLQLIKRFRLHVLNKRKQTIFSGRHIN